MNRFTSVCLSVFLLRKTQNTTPVAFDLSQNNDSLSLAKARIALTNQAVFSQITPRPGDNFISTLSWPPLFLLTVAFSFKKCTHLTLHFFIRKVCKYINTNTARNRVIDR